MSNRSWLAVVPGGEINQAPLRELSYQPDLTDTSRVWIRLNYQVKGFWIHSNHTTSDQTIHIPGVRVMATPGAPKLPMDVFSIAIPRKSRVSQDGLRVEVRQQTSVPGTYRIPPEPPFQLERESIPAAPDPVIYESGAFFPETVAACGKVYTIDGMNQVVISVFPIAYAPQLGQLIVRNSIQVSLLCLNGSAYALDEVKWHSPAVQSIVGYNHTFLRSRFSGTTRPSGPVAAI
ncbi:MAG: hypothetical protein HY774_10975 [Acidobacteria bacterium]|nr:hypothetical protein [Acidobacteriota bacterium]